MARRVARRGGSGIPDPQRVWCGLAGRAALPAAGLGVLAMVGWFVDDLRWAGAVAGLPETKFNTGVSLALLAMALVVVAGHRRRLLWTVPITLLPVVVLAVGALSAWAGGPGVGLDELFAGDAGATDAPGRMAPTTSLALLALVAGTVLLALRLGADRPLGRAGRRVVTVLATVPLLLAVLTVIGLLFEGRIFFSPLEVRVMAPLTAAAIVLLGLELLTQAPTRPVELVFHGGSPAALLLRRTLPAALLASVVISWLRWQGQLLGLYDAGTGVALNLVAIGTVFAALLVLSALTLDRQEQALETQRVTARLFQAVLDQSPAAIFVKDAEGRYVLANAAVADVLGHPVERVVGATDAELLPRELAERLQADDAAARDGTAALDVDERMLGPDGARTFRTSKFPIRVRGRDEILVGGIATDVTERLELEGRLVQAERLETVGQLAGGVAHDFNNLLTVIAGRAELALMEDDLSAARPSLEQILAATARASDLSRDLLTFARRDAGQAEGTCRPDDVVRELDRLLQPLLGEDVQLGLVLDAGDARIPMTATRLEQAVLNLAVNARDAMPDGGQLRITSRIVALSDEEAQDLPAVRAGVHVELTVSDTGDGMSVEVREHAFDPFFTTKAPGLGTGLGLASTYGLVTAAAGSISLDSAAGRGTTVRILLPAVTGDRTDPVDDGSPDDPSRAWIRGEGRTVLLLEDDDDVRAVTRRHLEDVGFRVVEAASAAQALALGDTIDRPDLIVSDVVLQDGAGPLVVRKLGERWSGVPVLFVSGYTERTGRWIRASDRVLAKPFTALALQRAIAGVLATAMMRTRRD